MLTKMTKIEVSVELIGSLIKTMNINSENKTYSFLNKDEDLKSFPLTSKQHLDEIDKKLDEDSPVFSKVVSNLFW